ncbi:TlpA family protein disulfide reductase [Antrihabitans stalactiti]|uniref:TlpA family protein disulfide reductase n=1 Tax=Antrihabitans stalactiti TaxID=2584121 RepID=A0A848KEV6_9NOCA|nr:TlpA disulfide reductase family protein [Antrihabitans stalactiti]NMN96839.1 TlpA family protein disulfide reductase [Antrihabitans stalactiti]
MPNAGRWGIAALIVIGALVVALWPRGEHDDRADQPSPTATAESPEQLLQARTEAALADCPAGDQAASGPLAGITLECLANGRSVDLGRILAGRPALLNLWAFWCAPCAEELPVLAEYAAKTPGVDVLTVHSDASQTRALARLTDLGVRLGGVQDAGAKVRAAVGAPSVLPITVLVRPDGTIAKVIAKPFTSVDEIAAAVEANLGVAA